MQRDFKLLPPPLGAKVILRGWISSFYLENIIHLFYKTSYLNEVVNYIERCFTWVSFGLTCRHKTRLELLAGDKYSSMLRTFVNYDRKKLLDSGPKWMSKFT